MQDRSVYSDLKKTNRSRASSATAAAPPCSESWVASATSAAEAYYQVETK